MMDRSTERGELSRDLPQNRFRLGRGIGSLSDGPSHDNVAGSGGDRFGGSYYTPLIGMAGSGRPHAGSNDREAVSQFPAQGGSLTRGRYYAAAAFRQRQRGQPQYLLFDRAGNPGRLQIVLVHAGEHRDGQHY